MKPTVALLATLLLAPLAAPHAANAPALLPLGWEPALAGDRVLQRLVKVSAPQVKGAHDAEFDGRRYVAMNNFLGKQNALAVLHDDFTTFEVIGHYNEPQLQQPSESAVNRLLLDERNAVSYPDGFESPDGLIHILYDWNRHTDAEILMAKFREEDVLAGKIVSRDAKLLMLANKATEPKPEKLYNGIELPDQWPPRFRDPNSAEPLEVPYLSNPLKVIPIDIGRQLFVDDFLIESTESKRVFHQATKYEGNPVFKAQTERELGASTQGERGEEATTFTGQGGIFYDPSEKLFKMFYVERGSRSNGPKLGTCRALPVRT